MPKHLQKISQDIVKKIRAGFDAGEFGATWLPNGDTVSVFDESWVIGHGFIVGGLGTELVTSRDKITPKIVRNWLAKNESVVALNGGVIGWWLRESDGAIVVDASSVWQGASDHALGLASAVALGAERGEECIWDMTNVTTVPCA